jgi:hypothetical protein
VLLLGVFWRETWASRKLRLTAFVRDEVTAARETAVNWMDALLAKILRVAAVKASTSASRRPDIVVTVIRDGSGRKIAARLP